MKQKKKNDTFEVETRAYACEITTRDDEKRGNVIEGHPIVYNAETNIGGMWLERIEEGALNDTNLKDVMLLVNHNRDGIPLARSRNNNENSTMQLSVAEDGLHIRANIDKTNPRGAELLSAVSRGDINGMSFAFTVEEDRWEDLESDLPKRTITKIGRVMEVSAVNNPAYEQTSISTRSRDNALETLESERRALERAKEEAKLRAEILNSLKEVRND